MITAIDTNIFLDILVPNPAFCDASANALESSVNSGSLVICDLVYAELSVHFGTQPSATIFWKQTRSGLNRWPDWRFLRQVGFGEIFENRVVNARVYWQIS